MSALNFNIQDLTAACNRALKELTSHAKADCNVHSDRITIECYLPAEAREVNIQVSRWEILLLRSESELAQFLRTLLIHRGVTL